MAQNLIIMNTHLKDANNILAQKNLLAFLSSKTFKMIVDDIINEGKIPRVRSCVKMPVGSNLNCNWKGVSIYIDHVGIRNLCSSRTDPMRSSK